MAPCSLNNDSNEIYNQCFENLIKAEALIDLALNKDISETPAHVTHDYLWGLSEFIKKAKKACENLGSYITDRKI